MVDCGASQCAQKRRILKKELLAWTKKVPILVGAEEAAGILLGRRRTKFLLEPLRRLESSEPTDWKPQLTCSFCEAKTKFTMSLIKERDEALKAGITLPESYQNLLDMLPAQCNHLSNGLENNNKHPHHPSNGLRKQQGAMSSHTIGSFPSPSSLSLSSASSVMYDPDQPLDLSASSAAAAQVSPLSTSTSSSHKSTKSQHPPLKVPHVEMKLNKAKASRESGKRGYTEQELTAAVTDIRSGKLGTRRAAALYGIPRSTLRNKICRLEHSNRSSTSPASPAPPPPPPPPPPPAPPQSIGMPDIIQQHLNAAAAMSLWYPPPPPPLLSPPTSSSSAAAGGSANPPPPEHWLDAAATADISWQQKLQMLRKKHDLNAGLERPFGMPPMFFNSPPLFPFDSAAAALGWGDKLSMAAAYNPYAFDDKLPFLQDLVRKFAEQRVEMDHMETDPKGPTDFRIKHEAPEDLSVSTPKPLKVPTFKRSAGEDDKDTAFNSDANAMKDAVKDLLSKERNDPSAFFSPFTAAALPFATAYGGLDGFVPTAPQLDHPLLSLPTSVSPPKKARVTEPKKSSTYQNGTEKKPSTKENNKTSNNNASSSSSSSSSGSSPKKSRPKRGQYRRYNHELLMEAVKAVQRGEMSVHRAGSYYGVPHSTLEYKVKERHLLRQKKSGTSNSGTTTPNGTSSPNDGANTNKNKEDGGNTAENGPLSPSSSANDNNQDESSKQSMETDGEMEASKPGTPVSQPSVPAPAPAQAPKSNGLKLTPFMLIRDEPKEEMEKNERSEDETTEKSKKGKEKITKKRDSTSPPALNLSLPQFPQFPKRSPSSSPAPDYLVPPFPPLPGLLPPVGFGWPPYFPGFSGGGSVPGADPGLAAAAAAAYGGAFSGINLSASDLLKQLQQKVERDGVEGSTTAKTAGKGTSEDGSGDSGIEPGELAVK